MNRVAAIEQLRATQETLEKLLDLLESSEQDRFVSHLPALAANTGLSAANVGKGGKQIERCIVREPCR